MIVAVATAVIEAIFIFFSTSLQIGIRVSILRSDSAS